MCKNVDVYSTLAYLNIINLNKTDPILFKNEGSVNHAPHNVTEDWSVIKASTDPTTYPTTDPTIDLISDPTDLYEQIYDVIQKYDLIRDDYYYYYYY